MCSFLGSAVYIRPKPPDPQDNCVCLLNFRDVPQRTLKRGTKFQSFVGREESSPEEPTRSFIIL